MSKKKRSHSEEGEHENSERWLLTYADMMTLLVCFFIIMYSMSVVNIKKFSAVAIAIRSGFGGSQEGSRGDYFIVSGDSLVGQTGMQTGNKSSAPVQSSGGGMIFTEEENRALSAIKRQIAMLRLDRVMEPIVDIPSTKGNKFKVVLTDQVFFDPDSAKLKGVSRQRLAELGAYVTNGTFNMVVDGYSGPLTNGAAHASTWQLSAERASSVIEALVADGGVNPRRLALHSHGEWTIYGMSRRVALLKNGEWREYAQTGPESQDRVVIWIVLD